MSSSASQSRGQMAADNWLIVLLIVVVVGLFLMGEIVAAAEAADVANVTEVRG